jgi:hypothetical protein
MNDVGVLLLTVPEAARVLGIGRSTVYDVRLRTPDGRQYKRSFRTRKEAETFEARQHAVSASGEIGRTSGGRSTSTSSGRHGV